MLLQKIDATIAAGVDWIQIREKDLSPKDLCRVVRHALRSAEKHPAGHASARILVNDRLDVALAEGAGGVHLRANSLNAKDSRELIRNVAKTRARLEDFLVGVSCHSRYDAEIAAASRADYIFFGPVFATPSKAAFGAPQGLDQLAEVCRALTIPAIAIGGITIHNAQSCMQAGASGIAAIRLFQAAVDPNSTIRILHQLAPAAPSA